MTFSLTGQALPDDEKLANRALYTLERVTAVVTGREVYRPKGLRAYPKLVDILPLDYWDTVGRKTK